MVPDTFAWVVAFGGAVLSLLFAACNYALRTFNHIRLEEALARRNAAHLAEQLRPRLGQMILATATLRIFFNVAVILSIAHLLRNWAGVHWSVHVVLVGTIACAVIVVFSVTVPNAWAKYAGEPLLAATLPALRAVCGLLLPVTGLLHGLDEVVRRLIGAPRVNADIEHVERQILSAVSAGQREGLVGSQEKAMIESVLEFRDTRADKIMVPRTDVVALDVADDLTAMLKTIHETGHSRIPVYEGNLDNVVGVLYAKDLLWYLATGRLPTGGEQGDRPRFSVREVMRPPLFIPESRSLRELLNDLRRTKVHLAVVLDEFGGTAGVVTIEDILEEIVGEISDEHERPAPKMIRRIDERTADVDGRAHVDDLNDQLKIALPEEEGYDTISGLVISALGHIPKAGERVEREGVVITVVDAEPRKINRLRLELTAPAKETSPR